MRLKLKDLLTAEEIKDIKDLINHGKQDINPFILDNPPGNLRIKDCHALALTLMFHAGINDIPEAPLASVTVSILHDKAAQQNKELIQPAAGFKFFT